MTINNGNNSPLILVTGGAGYIGSHTVLALQQAGFQVLILDSLERGHRDLVESVLKTELIVGHIGDRSLLDWIFQTYPVTAVMHFAAYIEVGESVRSPDRFYQNNVYGALTLLQAMVAAAIPYFVFSSTAAVYGLPSEVPIRETCPCAPINPYGRSKWMVEQIAADMGRAYGLKSVIFRYFNAAGADPDSRLGEDHHPETHLIPLVLQAAMGRRPHICIYGTDYPTPDGTCIRDYIHVVDLAQAHVLGLKYLLSGGDSQIFNLGNGQGFSVRQIIEAAQRVTGCSIPVVEGDRRAGDAAILVANSDRARQILGWQPQYPDIEQIIDHAWRWHQYRHGSGTIVAIYSYSNQE
ncbi:MULTISPECIES: UDP-glucose 4-epimerase GalE [unclassified Thermosynechococcus]|uniref:UDP-glucose 4-epimerase GalE n=2 Tax=Thermosynechococcus TaxID=146785 RepID=UPI00197D3C88|nr:MULTISPECIES: UDP-glucose 4-epimerase GalE [unclassified Thermosynechococcus]MDR5639038.1 UDP-glucose 4-epimerase GalE [Thermosynechococcus sp. PP42]MDR7922544.1 UDP-glucose 4-epimerase GalE [Thermosynechococcus sp. HY213]QSF48393.1 UDP-glucose 4-epimerase GalE [Thermosynechococcus sp. TA-1]WKT80358.1 UDP-glucose 4-epimerase GalE [Thermosynechococcus sp. PP45]WNC23968.1 UDP-glucose 4-epimerase GalE [Thermosynechococcus sp. PP551]